MNKEAELDSIIEEINLLIPKRLPHTTFTDVKAYEKNQEYYFVVFVHQGWQSIDKLNLHLPFIWKNYPLKIL